MVTEIQRDPDYTDAINCLLDLLTKFVQKAKQVAGELAAEAQVDTQLEKAVDLGQQILTNFSGRNPEGIKNAVRSLIHEAEDDDVLNEYFQDIDRFLQRCLKEEGFVVTDPADHQAHELYEYGKELTAQNEKYRQSIDQIVDEFEALFTGIRDDRGNRRVMFTGKNVFEDFVTKDGRVDLWRDFRESMRDVTEDSERCPA